MAYKDDPEKRRAWARKYLATHLEQAEKARVRARVQQAAKRADNPHWQRRQSIYQELVEMQGGELCLICGAGPAEKKRLFIDHDHSTDEIRGLLCPRCNRLLGNAADSVEVLRKCIEYLERPRFTGRYYADYQISTSWFGQKVKGEDAA